MSHVCGVAGAKVAGSLPSLRPAQVVQLRGQAARQQCCFRLKRGMLFGRTAQQSEGASWQSAHQVDKLPCHYGVDRALSHALWKSVLALSMLSSLAISAVSGSGLQQAC